MTSASRGGQGESPREIVTATGWRIHGSAADLVSPAALAGLHPHENETDIIFAVAFYVRPRLGTDPLTPVLNVLQSAVSAAYPTLRPLSRDGAISEVSGRSGITWATRRADSNWTGELVWLHAHPAVSGVTCTTHVVISDQPGRVQLTVRVGTPNGSAAVRGPVGMGQSRPAFLTDLHRRVRLIADGATSDARILTGDDIPDFVRNTLLSETRTMPVAVVAPTEEGDYLVPLPTLAEELTGLAHLYALDRHPTTFRLTDELGDRRLSCYWGALRIYLPEFSCADAPESHPLLTNERIVDPVMRASILGQLAIQARRRIPMPVGVNDVRSDASAAPAASAPARSGGASQTDATATSPAPAIASGEVTAVVSDIAKLSKSVSQLVQLTESLLDEVNGLRVTTNVRAGNASNVERRIGRLERLLREHLASLAPEAAAANQEPDEAEEETHADAEERVSLRAIVQQAAMTHSDALLILESAESSASDSPFDDVERVANVLEAMALIARRRQAGTLGESLRDAFRKSGIDYRGGTSKSTSARLRQQYEAILTGGIRISCDEHIVLGNSYDPRYCLRIYFSSRAPGEARFVIPHIGRHFDVLTTT